MVSRWFMSAVLLRERDVLESELTAGELLARSFVSDHHLPQLLRAAREERFGGHVRSASGCGPEKICGVMHANRKLSVLCHCMAGTDARGALDNGRVKPTVHHAPRCVVILPEVNVAGRRIDVGAREHGTEVFREHDRVIEKIVRVRRECPTTIYGARLA